MTPTPSAAEAYSSQPRHSLPPPPTHQRRSAPTPTQDADNANGLSNVSAAPSQSCPAPMPTRHEPRAPTRTPDLTTSHHPSASDLAHSLAFHFLGTRSHRAPNAATRKSPVTPRRPTMGIEGLWEVRTVWRSLRRAHSDAVCRRWPPPTSARRSWRLLCTAATREAPPSHRTSSVWMPGTLRPPVVVLGAVADPTSAQHLVRTVPATEVAACPSAERDESRSVRFFFPCRKPRATAHPSRFLL